MASRILFLCLWYLSTFAGALAHANCWVGPSFTGGVYRVCHIIFGSESYFFTPEVLGGKCEEDLLCNSSALGVLNDRVCAQTISEIASTPPQRPMKAPQFLSPKRVRIENASRFLSFEIPQGLSQKPFEIVSQAIEEKMKERSCFPNKTLLVFDPEDTVSMESSSPLQAVPLSRGVDEIEKIHDLEAAGVVVLAESLRPSVNMDVVRQILVSPQLLWPEQGGQIFFKSTQPLLDRWKEAGLRLSYATIQLEKSGLEEGEEKVLSRLSLSELSKHASVEKGRSGFFLLRERDKLENPSDFLNKSASLLYYKNGFLLTSGQARGESLKRLLHLKGLDSQFKCLFFLGRNTGFLGEIAAAYASTPGLNIYEFNLPNVAQ